MSREADPLIVDEGNADAADRTAEGQSRQLGRCRCRVDGKHVVQVDRIKGHDRDDDLNLVAQALLEGRTKRPVDEAAGEDGVLAWAPLTTEE